MESSKAAPTTIDEYISRCPEDVQPVLKQMRAVIRQAAPEAVEKISYRMPAFHYKGALVWFGVQKRHIGFYPTATGVEAFRSELAAYKSSKGAVQLPLDEPIPYDLIGRIVKFKVAENEKRGGRSSA